MRLPLLSPRDLTPEQEALAQDMRAVIGTSFQEFVSIDRDGTLVGPFNPWLHLPHVGAKVWDLIKAIGAGTVLPARVREVVILTTGAHFRAAYELYAHAAVAEARGLAPETIAALAAGQRPATLSAEEALAHDVAAALLAPGPLPDVLYAAARTAFGAEGAQEMVHLVGVYALISVTLNGFDVPVPTAGQDRR